VAVTSAYVILTSRLVRASREQTRLASSPLVGIRLVGASIGVLQPGSRAWTTLRLHVANVGNGPAVSIHVDAELCLSSNSEVYAADSVLFVSWLRSGEERESSNLAFSPDATVAFVEDRRHWREGLRPEMYEFEHEKQAIVTLYAYYSNGLGQGFESKYESEISIPFDDIGAFPSVETPPYEPIEPFTFRRGPEPFKARTLELGEIQPLLSSRDRLRR